MALRIANITSNVLVVNVTSDGPKFLATGPRAAIYTALRSSFLSCRLMIADSLPTGYSLIATSPASLAVPAGRFRSIVEDNGKSCAATPQAPWNQPRLKLRRPARYDTTTNPATDALQTQNPCGAGQRRAF